MASAPGPEPPAVGMRRYAGMVNSMACGGVFEPRNILVTGGCGFTGVCVQLVVAGLVTMIFRV